MGEVCANAPLQDREVEISLSVSDELLQICFTDTTDRIDIRCPPCQLDDNKKEHIMNLKSSHISSDNHEDWKILLAFLALARQTSTRLSSTLALPSTSRPPLFPRTHGRSCANRYDSTMRSLAWLSEREV